MQTHPLIYGFVGLIAGVLISMVFLSPQTKPQTPEIPQNSQVMMNHGSGSMEDMVQNLKGKSGNDFDKEFIIGMIEHHEGAIEMANEAKLNAGHDEIKKMAGEIIEAQSKEIEQMKTWQKDWGFSQ